MDNSSIELIQAGAFISLGLFMSVMLYGYIFHLYKRERTGERNYEQYSKLALDDELTSEVLEKR